MEHDLNSPLPYKLPSKQHRRKYTLESINEARERLGKVPYRQALAIALGWTQPDDQVADDIAYLRGEPRHSYHDYIWMRYGQ